MATFTLEEMQTDHHWRITASDFPAVMDAMACAMACESYLGFAPVRIRDAQSDAIVALHDQPFPRSTIQTFRVYHDCVRRAMM